MLAYGDNPFVDLFFKGRQYGRLHEITENCGQYQNNGNDQADYFIFQIQCTIHADSVAKPGRCPLAQNLM
jgi:hypothetical protein